jgi:hypothetical protein
MADPLVPDATSVGVEDKFQGNFTKAFYLRAKKGDELEKLIGYGAGRLAKGWWLLFALEKPLAVDFQFGGYNHFSGSRIGHPSLGEARPTVDESLAKELGGEVGLRKKKVSHIAALEISGPQRLAKVLPVAAGADYPVGPGIYQCNITKPILCEVAAFIPPGGEYVGQYT